MKKLLFPLAILLVVAFIITGCSTSTPTPTTGATSIPTSPAITTSAISIPPTTTKPAITSPVTTPPVTPAPPTSAPVSTTKPLTSPKYGGVLRYITASGPGAPFGAPWLSNGSSTFGMQLGAQFLLREMADGSIQPNLASSYDVVNDPNNASITFHLQKGVKFSDGTDCNAQAVKWNLDKEMVVGSTNIGSTANWKSVDVVDDYTIRVSLKTWQNTALPAFANSVAFIVSPTAFQKNGADWINYNLVGTGAFVQKDFQRDVKLSFTRNPNYYEPAKPYLDGIDYLFVPDSMTAEALFKSGGGDVLQNYSELMSSRMQAAGYKLISQPGMGSSLIPDSMNADSPWSNVKFRMAVEYAIDKEAVAKGFGYGFWQTSYQSNPSYSLAYDPNLPKRVYDIAKAKQLLTDAGYPNGVKTNVYVSPFGANQDIAVALQAYLSKVGIQVTLQYPQTGAWSQMLTGTWHNGVLFGPGPLSANPNSGWGTFAQTSAWYQSVKKPDGWFDSYAASLQSPKLDPELLKKCEGALYNDVTTIPLWVATTTWTVADNLQDTGLGTRGIFAWFEPQNAWFSK